MYCFSASEVQILIHIPILGHGIEHVVAATPLVEDRKQRKKPGTRLEPSKHTPSDLLPPAKTYLLRSF